MAAGSFVSHMARRRRRGVSWRRETSCERPEYLEARKQREHGGGGGHISGGEDPRGLRGGRWAVSREARGVNGGRRARSGYRAVKQSAAGRDASRQD